MLQSIRDRSRSWGAKIIIGAVVVTLALFGVESLVGLLGNSADEIAEVNGEPITRQQLELEVQRAIRSGQVPPEQERALRNEMLERLVADRLLTQYVEKGGMHLSEEQLDQLIVTLPEFQDAQGRFDRELFRNRLASAGFTPMAFREALRVDMKRQQLQQGLAFSDFTLPAERERLAALQNQARDFRYVTLTASDLVQAPEIDEAALRRHYEENPASYRRPEQVRLAYVVLDREALVDEVEIEEEQLRERWRERNRDADRRVSHIMLGFGDARSREEARATLEAVRERLAEGESFAELAAEVSEDDVSAEQGGDLGLISRGFFGDAFDEAAFSLEEGQVSEIVATDNGLHLLKVTEIAREPFSAVRDELRRELARERVNDEFNQRAQRLIDESFAAEDLSGVAERLSLPLQESDWVSRDSAEGVLAEPGVMAAAFSPDVLEEGFNSEVIELDEDRRLVLRVVEHRESSQPPFEAVRDEVRADLLARYRREALVERAAERVTQLRNGEELDIDWQRVEGATRQSPGGVSEAVVRGVFRLPRPEGDASVYGHAVDGDAVVLIALDRVEDGEVDTATEEFVARMSERLRTQGAIRGLLEHLRDQAEIERL